MTVRSLRLGAVAVALLRQRELPSPAAGFAWVPECADRTAHPEPVHAAGIGSLGPRSAPNFTPLASLPTAVNIATMMSTGMMVTAKANG